MSKSTKTRRVETKRSVRAVSVGTNPHEEVLRQFDAAGKKLGLRRTKARQLAESFIEKLESGYWRVTNGAIVIKEGD